MTKPTIYCVTQAKEPEEWTVFLSAIAHTLPNYKQYKTLSDLPDFFKNHILLYLASGCSNTDEDYHVPGGVRVESLLSVMDDKYSVWLRIYSPTEQEY